MIAGIPNPEIHESRILTIGNLYMGAPGDGFGRGSSLRVMSRCSPDRAARIATRTGGSTPAGRRDDARARGRKASQRFEPDIEFSEAWAFAALCDLVAERRHEVEALPFAFRYDASSVFGLCRREALDGRDSVWLHMAHVRSHTARKSASRAVSLASSSRESR
jgi:hypothetical protein